MKKKKTYRMPGRPPRPMPEMIDDTPENVARVLMGVPPDWMERPETEKEEEEERG